MLTNYFKITLAVMKRRKFFTFISLFGISMTLSILILATAVYEHIFSARYPEINRERSLYCMFTRLENTKEQGMMTGPMSVRFIKQYISSLKTPEKVGFASTPNTINTYGNGKKLRLYFKYTDPIFWEITQFDFLEGRPYTQQDIDNNEQTVVINEDTRDNYFGKNTSAVGKNIEIDGQSLRVCGVVRGCPITRIIVSSDVYMPYHLEKSAAANQGYNGSFMAIVMAKNKADLPLIQAEYDAVVSRMPMPPSEGFKADKITSKLDPFFESVTGIFFSSDQAVTKTRFTLFVSLLILLFMSLPAINLVNINVSRIMERASEIGIRKAFGASAKTMTMQFIIENIILTIMGGALALLLAGLLIWRFNNSDILPYADLQINWKVAGIALLLSFVFGLLSGVYPAWRMSKLPAAEALRAS